MQVKLKIKQSIKEKNPEKTPEENFKDFLYELIELLQIETKLRSEYDYGNLLKKSQRDPRNF